MNNKELFYTRAKSYFKDRYQDFLNELNKPQTHGFCINTKKANEEEILKIIDFEYEKYNQFSFRHNNLSIGKSIAHELGLIYSQGLEASQPCLLPETSKDMLVVDLCAAPGGKTINILNRVDDNSIVISNEYDYSRSKALTSNLERLGYENVIVTSKKTKDLAIILENSCDLVILDAPCSGEGMIRKYPEILDDYSLKNIENLSRLQSELLEDAYKCLKPNGQLLYSTCTFAFEEDEKQIENFLNKHSDIKMIGSSIKMSFLDKTEGQFMILLKRNGINELSLPKYRKTISNKLVESFIKNNIYIDKYFLYRQNDYFYLSLIPLYELGNNVIRYGLCLGKIVKDRFEPHHSLYRSNKLKFKYTYELNDNEYIKYIEGNELSLEYKDCYIQILYKGFPLGYGKVSKNRLKNKYPKGLRRVL